MAYLDENPRSPWHTATLIVLSLLFALGAFAWWIGFGAMLECLPRGTPATATCDSHKHWIAILEPIAAISLYSGARWLERRDPVAGLMALTLLTGLVVAPLLMLFL